MEAWGIRDPQAEASVGSSWAALFCGAVNLISESSPPGACSLASNHSLIPEPSPGNQRDFRPPFPLQRAAPPDRSRRAPRRMLTGAKNRVRPLNSTGPCTLIDRYLLRLFR